MSLYKKIFERKSSLLKKINIGLFVCVTLLTGFLINTKISFFKITNVPYTEQKWTDNPGLLIIKKETEKDPGIEVYRFKDAMPEKLAGAWNYSFSSPSELFLFGSFLNETNIQRLYILNDRGSSKRDISKLPGPILNISQNPKGTYLLVSGLSQNPSSTAYTSSTFYTCLTEKQSPDLTPCDSVLGTILPNYNKDIYYHNFWNQASLRELIMEELGGEKRIFSFDPWEDAPTLLTSTQTEKIVSEDKNRTITNIPFKQYKNIIVFKDTDTNKWKITFIPFRSQLRWADKEHLLIITPKKGIDILDVRQGLKSHFIDRANTPETKFSTYYSLEK